MQIYVNKLKNVDAYISIAENVVDIAAREKVMPSINKNYTQPPTSNYYITLIPKKDARLGEHEIDIDLNFYQYDPKCIQYTKWNGTDCVQ